MSDAEIEAATVGAPRQLNGPVRLVPYDPAWPGVFAAEAAGIHRRLAGLAHRLEHTGSTSVPGLTAKPIIDMLLVVPESADEASYVPALEPLGYRVVIREPDWHEHRVLRKTDPAPGVDGVNLHVLSAGSPEIRRVLGFRDRLRAHDAERDLYAETKRALAGRSWKYVQNYADAKSEVVEAILARALGD
ncbi:GrpB family protein [Streptomyces sp. DSM 44915]|uniref:GrpB family protein n=1 Tax=Streptomyces chisholmiae TaxID=3075540 RepID=A0ABU2JZI4_9ACTN|nr:GrpB family protein [Streptomyces sp. DSM 44915]MDT0270401.1 GrpB family protein [Streptomyces sp. DSM 44915]